MFVSKSVPIGTCFILPRKTDKQNVGQNRLCLYHFLYSNYILQNVLSLFLFVLTSLSNQMKHTVQ